MDGQRSNYHNDTQKARTREKPKRMTKTDWVDNLSTTPEQLLLKARSLRKSFLHVYIISVVYFIGFDLFFSFSIYYELL